MTSDQHNCVTFVANDQLDMITISPYHKYLSLSLKNFKSVLK